MMYFYTVLSLWCVTVSIFIVEGRSVQEDAVCREEHGACRWSMFENVRLLAQRSSGCKYFCQCAHASTEFDGSITYMWVKHECPAGTLFDDTLPAPVCNHANQVRCNGMDNGDANCRQEHGVCNASTYHETRLVALESSGCTDFCQCEHASTQWDGSVTYRWARHHCPAGTLFDESLKTPVCNHANQVHCNGDGGSGNGNGGTDNGNGGTDNGNGGTENGNGGTDNGNGGANNGDDECYREHGVCTRHTYEDIRLVALRSSGCEEFCQCEHASTQWDGSVTYKWAKHQCPAGTLFDERPQVRVCNHASEVKCHGGNDGDRCEREHGVCDRVTYHETRLVALESSGCTDFCQCEHASTQWDGSVTYRWARHQCPAGTLFDESLHAPVCNHANQVRCNGDGGSGNGNGGTDNGNGGTDNGNGGTDNGNGGTDNGNGGTDNGNGGTDNGNGGTDNGNGGTDNDDDECYREHGVCTRHTYEDIRLVALRSSGCEEFCQCEHASTQWDGSVTYKWAKHQCPAGTLFDERPPARVCNHASQVKCHGGNDGDRCEREHGVCNKFTYETIRLVALNSSGCEEFCQCEHASTQWDGSVTYRWARHQCPAGTLFDESLRVPVCNHASEVKCNGNTDNDNGNSGNGDEDNDGNSTDNDADSDSDGTNGGTEDGDNDSSNNDNAADSDSDGTNGGTEGGDNDSTSNDHEADSDSNGADSSTDSGNNEEDGSKSNAVDDDDHDDDTNSKDNDSSKTETDSKDDDKVHENDSEVKSDSDSSSNDNDGKSKSKSKSSKSKSSKSSKSKSSKSKQSKTASKSDSGIDDSDSDSGSKSKSKSKSSTSKSKSKSKISTSKSKSKSKSSTNKSKSVSGSNDSDSGSDSKSKSKSSKSKSTSKSTSKSSKSKSKSKHDGDAGSNDGDAEDELLEVSQGRFQCFKCHKEKTNSACNKETEICSHNTQSCQTTVEWRGDRYEVGKGCKNPTANSANAKLGCQKTGSKIFCRYECKKNLCNERLPVV